jgi:hypothetical protein
LVSEGFKVIPVLLRGAPGVGDPMNNKRLRSGQLFPGREKGLIVNKSLCMLTHLSIPSGRNGTAIITINVISRSKIDILER